MPDSRGYPTYSERFPSKEDYNGCAKLKEWYPASKYPALNAQWDGRMRQYEWARDVL